MKLRIKPPKLNALEILEIFLSERSIKANFKNSLWVISSLFLSVIFISIILNTYLIFVISSFILLITFSVLMFFKVRYFEEFLSELEYIKRGYQNEEEKRTRYENNMDTIEKNNSLLTEKIQMIGKNKALLDLYFRENEEEE
jgi:uncharacterized protein YacL